MFDEMQEEKEDAEEDKCNEKRWTKKIMLDEMQEEEEDKCRLRKKKKKKRNTTKLSYRSSEGRSSSRRSSKCQNYDEKTPESMRNANIHSIISTKQSKEIH